MKTLLVTALVFLSFAGGAAAATAPTVSSGAASATSADGATLNGSVNPNGEATTWYFEYGTNTNYGSKTAVQSASSGTSPVDVSAPVSGLQGSKLYHFRLVATSDGGTSQGADLTFSTGNAPAAVPTVATASASSIGSTTARLNGSVDPNGGATTWYFDYGPNTGYGLKTSAHNAGSGTRSTNVSASVSKLAAGSTYHFRLVASNAAGTVYGSDQSLTVSGPPAVQTNPAQSVGTTSATLTGSVDPEGRSTSWHFDYGPTAAYGSKTPSKSAGSGSGASTVSAAVSNLSVGTTYHFRLVASSSAGTSAGADVSFSTPAGLTMTQSAFRVVAGRYVTLSGTLSGGQTGIKVTMLAQPFGESSFTPIASVLTGGGGAWTYLARPTIATAYQASANGGTSSPVTIGVQPAVSLRLISTARFSTRVSAAGSFAGKLVQLQRLSSGHWVTVKRTRLSSSSTAIFRASLLPRGRSTIRVAISVNQAGPGYLGGLSRTLSYRRG